MPPRATVVLPISMAKIIFYLSCKTSQALCSGSPARGAGWLASPGRRGGKDADLDGEVLFYVKLFYRIFALDTRPNRKILLCWR